MPSPYSGMGPFLEACGLWEDFQPKLIGEIERTLAATLPPRYFVCIGVRSNVVLTDTEGKDFKPFPPDVGVTMPGSAPEEKPSALAVVEDAEAITMQAFVSTEYRETFLEIYTRDLEKRLVTAIEVLSPSNKRRGSEGWELYLRKRHRGHPCPFALPGRDRLFAAVAAGPE